MFYFDQAFQMDEANEKEETFINEFPGLGSTIVQEKSVRLLNYSLMIIQQNKIWKLKEFEDQIIQNKMKLKEQSLLNEQIRNLEEEKKSRIFCAMRQEEVKNSLDRQPFSLKRIKKDKTKSSTMHHFKLNDKRFINSNKITWFLNHPEHTKEIYGDKPVEILSTLDKACKNNLSVFNKNSNKSKEQLNSANLKLQRILKSFSSSSNNSNIEILALIISIDVKIELEMYDEVRQLLRHLDSVILKVNENKDLILNEILKQYKYYLQAKWIAFELFRKTKPNEIMPNQGIFLKLTLILK